MSHSSLSVTPATIHNLPDEILVQIFSTLTARETAGLKYVCKRWQKSAVSALRLQKVIGIGTLSVHYFKNERFHTCPVHDWHLDSAETIPVKQAKDLLKITKQADGSVTCPLYRMFPNLRILLIGSDVSLPDVLLQLWSNTLTCLCVHSRNDTFSWQKAFRLICYRGRHLSRSLVRSCAELRYVFCENTVDAHVVSQFRPHLLKFLTCDLKSLTDLCHSPAAPHLQSVNVNVSSGHTKSGGFISLPADYIRVEIPYTRALVRSLLPQKKLVKLILDFKAGQQIHSADLMMLLRRVSDVRQLSLQLVPGPNANVTNDIIGYISEMYQSLEELRVEFPGALFDASALTSLTSLSKLTTLMIRDGDFHAEAIISFLRNSASRSTLQRVILVTRVEIAPSTELAAEISDMKTNMSLRDVIII